MGLWKLSEMVHNLFVLQPTNSQLISQEYARVSLYKFSYMFRHFFVIFMEFYIFALPSYMNS